MPGGLVILIGTNQLPPVMKRVLPISLSLFVLSAMCLARPDCNFVDVYPGPEGLAPSGDYAVTILQGKAQYESFTYKNRNDDPEDANIRREVSRGIAHNPALKAFYSGDESFDWNDTEKYMGIGSGLGPENMMLYPEAEQSVSWTTFSFLGTVKVRITSLKGEVKSVNVLPSSKNVDATVEGNLVAFALDHPGKFAVIINNDYLNPLFIFADQPEMHRPDVSKPGVVVFRPGDDCQERKKELEQAHVLYFTPGEHEIGTGYPVYANQTIYLEGGAYVYGTFHGIMANNVSFRGRGILSGERIPRKLILEMKKDREKNNFERMKTHNISMLSEGNRESWNVYAQHGGLGCDNLLIEGITIVDASHFFARITGTPITVHNLKMVGGWHHNSDGISAIGQPNTTVFDCFFHCNDDGIYVRPDNVHIHNCLFWQGTNGAVFQWSWGGDPYDQGGGFIHDCDIIHMGHVREANNRAVFGSRKSGEGDIRDIHFKNINIEGPVWRLFRLNTYAGRGNPEELGSIHHILFENVHVNGPVINKSEIISGVGLEEGATTGSWVKDITFRNVTINGRQVEGADFIFGETNVENIRFK